MKLESYIENLQSSALQTIKAAEGFIDPRVGVARGIYSMLTDPDDPKLFDVGPDVADISRYTGNEFNPNAAGVGLTEEIAKAATIGELIERYSASSYDEENMVSGSYRTLESNGRLATDPRDYALYSAKQYDTGRVPYQPFTVDTTTRWVEGYSLLSKEPILVPACFVYHNYKFTSNAETVGMAMSTGMNCSRNREEGVLKGIFEVVERDATTITWLNRLSMPRVDLRSSQLVKEVFESRFNNSGAQWHLIDVTNDSRIPSMICVYVDERKDGYAAAVGSAANLNPELAALRALLEAAQCRVYVKLLRREGPEKVKGFASHVQLYGKVKSLPRLRFFYSSETLRACNSLSGNIPSGHKQLDYCLELLKSVASDVIVIDVTSDDVADLGFYVTKVIIPNFNPLTLGALPLGGKRLYEVPVRLGYKRLTEEELNPFPHPFP